MEKEKLVEVINQWRTRCLSYHTGIRIYQDRVHQLADMIIEHIIKEMEKEESDERE